jgi:hypothetical protein
MIARALFVCAVAAMALTPRAAGAEEIIHKYDTAIIVQADGALHITETIDVTAEGGLIQRGIFRTLPAGRRMPLGGVLPTQYEILSVSRNGHEEPYFTQNGGGALTIYIGDADVLLSHGRHSYELSYTVPGQVMFGGDIDELNWNAIGTEWDFPIAESHTTITLPDGIAIGDHAVYTGAALSTEDTSETQVQGNRLNTHTGRLEPGEGVTIALSWPAGLIDGADQQSGLPFFLRQHPGLPAALAAFLATLLYYMTMWRRHGRDPRQKRLAPFYTPPQGVSPAMAAYIRDMGETNTTRMLSAAVISLAAKGFIEIAEDEDGVFTLTALPAPNRPGVAVSADEDIILSGIGQSMKLSPSNTQWQKISSKHDTAVAKYCGKKYFTGNGLIWFAGCLPLVAGLGTMILAQQTSVFVLGACVIIPFIVDAWRAALIDDRRSFRALRHILSVAILLPLATAALILAHIDGSWLAATVLAATLLIIAMTRYAMKRPTTRGIDVMEQIDGLQYYMEAVEEKILKEFDPPQMSRQLYEDFLPYAIALDVESKWGAKFAAAAGAALAAAAVTTQPSWYKTSRAGSRIGNSDFSVTRMVGGFNRALAAASTSPSSGSSSSGGGRVGGGGGGGGGGGW